MTSVLDLKVSLSCKNQSSSDHDTEKPLQSKESTLNSKLNWLRAGVLGANDGIVSTAGLVVGVAGASVSSFALLASGIAGLAAGALSMAAGEYVSVSTQRDAERAAILRQKIAIAADPVSAEKKLANFIKEQGISEHLAFATARELSAKNAPAAHARYEFGINPDELTNPWHAAGASMIAFALGAIIPLIAIVFSPANWAIFCTAFAVNSALAITGSVSAYLGNAPILRATLRNVVWGNIAMLVTYFVGAFVGGNI